MKSSIVAVEDRRFYQHLVSTGRGPARRSRTRRPRAEVPPTHRVLKNYFLYVEAETRTERLKPPSRLGAQAQESQIALRWAHLSKRISHPYLNIVSFGT